MKKFFPLNEIVSTNNNKINKGINIIKNKENNKIKSPFPLTKNKNNEIIIKNNNKVKESHKTPIKRKDGITINKIFDNNNECNKANNNSTIITSKNKQQLFLVSCLLANNKNNGDKIQNNIKTNKILSTLKNKEYKKYLNKIQKICCLSKNQIEIVKKILKKISLLPEIATI